MKRILNQWDYIRHRCFCAAKKAISKTERQRAEQEKIFANHVSDTGLVPEISLLEKAHVSNVDSLRPLKGDDEAAEGGWG